VALGRSGGTDLHRVGEVPAVLAVERPVHHPELPVAVKEHSVDVAQTPSYGGLGSSTEAEHWRGNKYITMILPYRF
jgi:hypothetical protein